MVHPQFPLSELDDLYSDLMDELDSLYSRMKSDEITSADAIHYGHRAIDYYDTESLKELNKYAIRENFPNFTKGAFKKQYSTMTKRNWDTRISNYEQYK